MGWERSPLGWSWRVGSRASPLGLPGTSTQGMIPGQPQHLADRHIRCDSHIGLKLPRPAPFSASGAQQGFDAVQHEIRLE